MKTPYKILVLFKLCSFWRRHVMTTWNFEKIKDFHFWCMDCPLKTMGDIGQAYRRTIEQSVEE